MYLPRQIPERAGFAGNVATEDKTLAATRIEKEQVAVVAHAFLGTRTVRDDISLPVERKRVARKSNHFA